MSPPLSLTGSPRPRSRSAEAPAAAPASSPVGQKTDAKVSLVDARALSLIVFGKCENYLTVNLHVERPAAGRVQELGRSGGLGGLLRDRMLAHKRRAVNALTAS